MPSSNFHLYISCGSTSIINPFSQPSHSLGSITVEWCGISQSHPFLHSLTLLLALPFTALLLTDSLTQSPCPQDLMSSLIIRYQPIGSADLEHCDCDYSLKDANGPFPKSPPHLPSCLSRFALLPPIASPGGILSSQELIRYDTKFIRIGKLLWKL